MARPLRIEFPGAIYHVTSRMVGSWSNRRERLFRDAHDFGRFAECLQKGVLDFGIRLYLFCLMANHFHLVLETPRGNLSRFMHSLSTGYTVYFNRRHRRHGHLMDGRFKARVVSGDDYLLKLSRYVHQNPAWVEGWARRPIGERIGHLRAYRWSSYGGYIGKGPAFGFVDEEPVLAMMSGRGSARRQAYRDFIEQGLVRVDDEFQEVLKAPGLGIGDEGFRQWVERLRGKAMKEHKQKEDMAFRRKVAPLNPRLVLAEVAGVFGVEAPALRERRRQSPLKAVAARCLVRYAGRTQRESAALLGLNTGAAVSAQIKQLREWERQDRRLRDKVSELEKTLESLQAAREKPGRG
jgi:REP element-mobilizing transposase RayT